MISNVNAAYYNFSYIRNNYTNQETYVPHRCNRFGRPYDNNNIHRDFHWISRVDIGIEYTFVEINKASTISAMFPIFRNAN